MIKARGNISFYIEVLAVVASLFLAGSSFAAPQRMYTGPERPASETALIRGATTEISLESCDGVKITSLDVVVLPGVHTIGWTHRGARDTDFRKFTTEAGHTYVVDRKELNIPGRYSVLITDRTSGKNVSTIWFVPRAVAEQRLAVADKSIEQFPRKADFYGEKADMLMRLERYSEALQPLDTAISFTSNNPQLWAMKSRVLYELKRYDEALIAIDKAIALRPDISELSQGREFITSAMEGRYASKEEIEALTSKYW